MLPRLSKGCATSGIEGQNIVIERRYGQGGLDKYPALASS
jgi:hypothetical protein